MVALTINDVMFLLILPKLMVDCVIFLESKSKFQTWSASWPPIMNMSSRSGEKVKHEATNGLEEVRLPTAREIGVIS